jgi:hypothetical protein
MKSTLSHSDMGKLFSYLKQLCNCGNHNPRGLLYNNAQFFFAEYRDGSPIEAKIGLWETLGCLEYLREALRINEMNDTTLAVRHFVTSNTGSVVNAALGRGRYGIVFDVLMGDTQVVLKVVPRPPVDEYVDVFGEFNAQQQHSARYPKLVAEVVPDSLVITPRFSYYLLRDVGVGGNVEISARAVMLLLFELHQK